MTESSEESYEDFIKRTNLEYAELLKRAEETGRQIDRAVKKDMEEVDHAVKLDQAFRTILDLKHQVDANELTEKAAMQELIKSGALGVLVRDFQRNQKNK